MTAETAYTSSIVYEDFFVSPSQSSLGGANLDTLPAADALVLKYLRLRTEPV